MRALHEGFVRALTGTAGLVAGVLSAAALGLAALLGPLLGLLAVVLTPVRALVQRLRRTAGSAH